MNDIVPVLIIGLIATAITDLWSVIRGTLFGIPPPDFGLVGRWIGHMRGGRFRHDSIKAAAPVRQERLIGWIAHYVIGIGFAAILVAIRGRGWIEAPTLLPALIVGVATIAAPFLLMHPGMGLGMAASRTPNPGAARFHSLVTHSVFGLGLFAGGLLFAAITGP